MLGRIGESEGWRLAAYLEKEPSGRATAPRLGLHRGTVSARIQRFHAALGADLSDHATRRGVQRARHVAR